MLGGHGDTCATTLCQVEGCVWLNVELNLSYVERRDLRTYIYTTKPSIPFFCAIIAQVLPTFRRGCSSIADRHYLSVSAVHGVRNMRTSCVCGIKNAVLSERKKSRGSTVGEKKDVCLQ